MKNSAVRLSMWCFCAGAWPVMAQPFTCGEQFLGSDTQAELAQAIIEDGGRAVGVQRVFQIVLDGNHQASTASYKKRWHRRAVALLEVPDDKVLIR